MKRKTLKFAKREIADLTIEEQNSIIGGVGTTDTNTISCPGYACPDTDKYCDGETTGDLTCNISDWYNCPDTDFEHSYPCTKEGCPGNTYNDVTCDCY